MIPGEFLLSDEPVMCNADRETRTLTVLNRGDRPVQVGSHFHFAEANPALLFEREAAIGFRLDIPAGTAVRFEPGDRTTVRLVAYAGRRRVYGFHNVVDGALDVREPAPIHLMESARYVAATPAASDPAGPADPTNSAGPAGPANPADPTDPSDPAGPADPTNSADPTGPTDPAAADQRED